MTRPRRRNGRDKAAIEPQNPREPPLKISEYQRVEENLLKEKEFSEQVINNLPGIFYLFNQDGKFLRWNRNIEVVSGYSGPEIAAMSPLDFFDEEGKVAIANAIAKAFLEGQVSVEAPFVTKSGRRIPFIFSGHRLFLGGTPCLVGLGIDMSGRQEAIETQRATLNILEDFDEERRNLLLVQKAMLNLLEDMHEEHNRLNQTQRALLNILEDIELERARTEQAKVQIEATNRELEAFSYSVSHDLRAPLRAISGFAQAVVEDYSPRLDDEGQRYLGLIQGNAHRMGKLIDDLLAFSRLNRQQMTETSINLQALAREVFDELLPLTPDRKIQFTALPVPPAYGDQAMIRQVLSNLISNAIKFTRAREEASIEFGFLPDQEAYYLKDNGVGFDMRYVDKLFGVFQRLHSNAEFEGTGVGLALVQRIVSRHGGRAWAEGEIGHGATFYFTLRT